MDEFNHERNDDNQRNFSHRQRLAWTSKNGTEAYVSGETYAEILEKIETLRQMAAMAKDAQLRKDKELLADRIEINPDVV